MASQAWLEDSLRRSGALGLEVLQRASRRSVDWYSSAPRTPTDGDQQSPRTHTSLDDAFETIAEFMAQTTSQCKNFYQAHHCTEPTDMERTHVFRFHAHPDAGTNSTRISHKNVNKMDGEDFHIEVSPGTYAITAGMQDSGPQTQLVSLNAGESVNLTFNL